MQRCAYLGKVAFCKHTTSDLPWKGIYQRLHYSGVAAMIEKQIGQTWQSRIALCSHAEAEQRIRIADEQANTLCRYADGTSHHIMYVKIA
jgi:hypothetical protein